MGSKQNVTSTDKLTAANSTGSSSTSPHPQAEALYSDLLTRARGIADTPYQAYGGQLTAGNNYFQQNAGDALRGQAGNLSQLADLYNTHDASGLQIQNQALGAANTYSPYFNTAQNYASSAAQGVAAPAQVSASGISPQSLNLQQFLNPYTQSVIQATQANINESNAEQQQGVISNAIRSGNAFGGDRMGVAQSELARQQDLASNQTMAGLNQANYTQALGAAQQQQGVDIGAQQYNSQQGLAAQQFNAQLGLNTNQFNANLRNQAASLYAGLGNSAQSNTMSAYNTALGALNAQNATATGMQGVQNLGYQNAQGLSGIGGVYQNTQQAADTAAYQQYQNQIAFPYQQTGWLAGLGTGVGSQMGSNTYTTGSTSGVNYGNSITPGPSTFGSLLGLGTAAFGSGLFHKGGRVDPYHSHGFDNGGGIIPGTDARSLIPTFQITPGRIVQQFSPLTPGVNDDKDSVASSSAASSQGLAPALSGFAKALGNSKIGGSIGGGIRDAFGFGNGSFANGLDANIISDSDYSGSVYRRGGSVPRFDDGGPVDWAGDLAPVPRLYRGFNFAGDIPSALSSDMAWQPSQAAVVDAPSSRSLDTIPVSNAPAPMPAAGVKLTNRIEPQKPMDLGDVGIPAYDAAPAASAGLGAIDRAAPVAGLPKGDSGDDTFGRMIRQESGGKQFDMDGRPLTSRAGAIGVAQVMPGTAPYAAKLAGLPFDDARYRNDADYNRALGQAYYNEQLRTFGTPDKAAAAYNAGPGAVTAAMARAARDGGSYVDYLPAETRNYVANVTGGGSPSRVMAYAPPATSRADSLGDIQEGRSGGADESTLGGVAAKFRSMFGTEPKGDAQPSGALGLNLSPETRQALLAAGFGMMASKSHFLGNAIGEGGLAGVSAYNTAINAQRQNALAGSTIANTNSEIGLRKAQVDNLNRQVEAAQAAAGALRSGMTTPPGSSAPAPSVTSVATSPAFGSTPTGAASPVPSVAPTGAPQPASAPNTAPAPVTAANSPPRLMPQSDPAYLDKQADRLESIAYDPKVALSRDVQNDYFTRANQYRTQASAIRQSGTAMGVDGRMYPLPGNIETKSAIEAATTAARVQAENAGKPEMSPSGASFIRSPGQAAAPDAPAAPQGATIGNTPRALQIDPKTASVTTAIPVAPKGGGYPVPDTPAGAKVTGVGDASKELAKADGEFKDMIGKGPVIDQGIERFKSLATAFKLFQSGAGNEKLQGAAAIAQSFGYPDIAKKILGGDPAALQWVNKEGVNLTLDTLKAANPRFAQSEFNQLTTKGTPNPDILPQANHQMISEGLGTMMRNKAFVADWEQARANGWHSPSAFYTAWSQANPLGSFISAAQKQIGNFKGMPLPHASDWVEGTTYVAPKDMSANQVAAFARRGIKPGQMFRYNGRDADISLEPIAPSQEYSSYLH